MSNDFPLFFEIFYNGCGYVKKQVSIVERFSVFSFNGVDGGFLSSFLDQSWSWSRGFSETIKMI